MRSINHISRPVRDACRLVSRKVRDAYSLIVRVRDADLPQRHSGATTTDARERGVAPELTLAHRKRDMERSLHAAGWSLRQAKAEVAHAFSDPIQEQ